MAKNQLSLFINIKLKEVGLTGNKLATNIGMSFGNFRNSKAKGTFPSDKVSLLAEQLETTVEELISNGLKMGALYRGERPIFKEDILPLLQSITACDCEQVTWGDLEFIYRIQNELGRPISKDLINELLKHRK